MGREYEARKQYNEERNKLERLYPEDTLVTVRPGYDEVLHGDPDMTYVTIVTGHTVVTIPNYLAKDMPDTKVRLLEGARLVCSTNPPGSSDTIAINDGEIIRAEMVEPDRIVGMFE